MPRPSSRHRLLCAAADIVVRDGPSALTYDHLAEVTAVSKGGLLYHFPSKAALVDALLDDVLDRFERAVDERAGDAPGGWTHAYVDATFDVEVSRPHVVVPLLLASPAAGAELFARCAERFAHWQRRIESDGVPTTTALAVRYACDGWWTQRAFHGPTADADARHLRGALTDLLRTASVGAP